MTEDTNPDVVLKPLDQIGSKTAGSGKPYWATYRHLLTGMQRQQGSVAAFGCAMEFCTSPPTTHWLETRKADPMGCLS
ncbi:MAG: hypothetical protein JKY00_12445 [Roseicyclus sp.]|nr:hypothetical protein [Roseicyclus sp.]